MKREIILSVNPKYEYTLIIRLDGNGKPLTCEPYVVTWRYDHVTNTWAQGHYFQTLECALIYMHFKDKAEEIYKVIKDNLESPF